MTGRRMLLAAASGLLASLSFPSWISPSLAPWTGWIAWVSLVPLFAAIAESGPVEGALLGWLSGTVNFASTLYWIMAIRELESWSVPAWLALSLVLGAYWALWGMVTGRLQSRHVILLAPTWWIVTELLRGWFFTGFPWTPLGASQWRVPALFLSSRVLGVSGVSGCVVAVNACLWFVVSRKPGRSKALAGGGFWLGALAALSLWQAVGDSEGEERKLAVSALQGNFTEEEKNFLPSSVMIERYERLALGVAPGAAVHVWPETATASDIRAADDEVRRIMSLSEETGAAQLVGAIMRTPEGRYYNGAFLIGPEGIRGAYFKRHLVPFGEYVPEWFRNFAPFARKITSGLVDFSPGRAASVIALPSGHVLGALICYEALFAGEVRSLVKSGAEILVNITNDAWYRRTAASAQHALGPIARAVEFDRYLVRCANTGISLVITPRGDILAQTPLFATACISADVRPIRRLTWYARWGEWPLVLLFLISAGVCAAGMRKAGRAPLPSRVRSDIMRSGVSREYERKPGPSGSGAKQPVPVGAHG